MIGFFDSGIGGLTVLREFQKILPEYDYLYFGDNARCPYGGLNDATIRQYTEEGVQFLFDQGATIVVLACNTATAHAIQYLQQTKFPDRKILGVTIPGAEKILEGNYRKIGVLATESTVKNRAYKERVHIINNTIEIQEIAAPELVPLIENGVFEGELIQGILKTHLAKFDSDIEAIVLGCTHYPYVRAIIEQIRPGIDIIDPGFESAKKFASYLVRHPDIEAKIGKGGEVKKIWSKNL
ncbi:MAG: glutamate racemase [Candidatus Gracilibacteria bacterium]